MKKLLFALTISAILFSCSKDQIDQQIAITGNASLQYKVDGVLQQYSGDANTSNPQGVIAYKQLKGTIIPATRHMIQAQSGANNLISLDIVTDSLRPGLYKGELFFTFILTNGTEYGIFDNNQILNVSITRNSSGTIDGIFSGNLYWIKDAQDPSAGFISVSITEGEFKNIRMIY